MLLLYSHDQLYKHICMQKQRRHSKDERHSPLEKYTYYFIWKGSKGLLKVLLWEEVGKRTELQYIDPHSYGHNCFFLILLGCSTGGLGAQSLWDMFLIPASSLQLVWTPTDWTSCAPSYIIVRRPPSSCGRHKSHSFNLSTVKVISWYSSTGCTCYLHRCISYFDRLAGVSMLHYLT